MSDIIRLLPDSIANQIAAGEVIQRPASVVKELLENAIDAGATRIQLIIKEAGKTLLQVIDNGSGMSEMDARMSFERHATSKIRHPQDLETIKTMGFRGEALASIAAVAQVELKTKLHSQDLGTRILIAGSKLEKQEPIQTPAGTNFSVSNLFFNTPARRKFLKSDPVELKNILEEFEHIAIAYPEIEMSCINNGQEIYILPKGNLKQRIIGVFGKSMNEKIVTVEEQTDLVKIGGFIGKVEVTKKKRGDQYLFVNRRFIKSSYLHHAVKAAYESLIDEEDHPFYVLFLDLDPSRIDVNIHPSKHEIKFLDERIIYQYIRVACRHALGQYVNPSFDFEASDKGLTEKIISSRNTFDPITNYNTNIPEQKSNSQEWRKVYDILKNTLPESLPDHAVVLSSRMHEEDIQSTESEKPQIFESNLNEPGLYNTQHGSKDPYQIHQSYIISPVASGFMIIDQEAAHQRIIFDKTLHQLESKAAPSQRTLFPTTLNFSGSEHALLESLLPSLNLLGFELEPFGTSNFIVHGTPMDWNESVSVKSFIEQLLREMAQDTNQKINYKKNLANYYARYQSIKPGQTLTTEEMKYLIDQLFACTDSTWGPFGGKCYTIIEADEIAKRLK